LSPVTALSLLGVAWPALLALAIGALCAVIAAAQLRKTKRLKAPAAKALLSELLAEVAAPDADASDATEQCRRAALAELNQRLSDISFELRLLPTRLTALTRISLASGTSLALLGYIGSSGQPALQRALGLSLCAFGGAGGAALVSAIGRTAKRRAAQIREDWDRSSRETGKALGASLETSQQREGGDGSPRHGPNRASRRGKLSG